MSEYDFALDLETKNTISVTVSWLEKAGCKRILELGPANGRLTRYLRETLGCSVTIVEIDEDAGTEAARYADKAYIGETEGDIEKYFWKKEDPFDRIILNDVLEHLHDLKSICCIDMTPKLLADDGEIIISIPNVSHNSVLIGLGMDRFDYDHAGLLDRTHVHFFTGSTFTEMIRDAGLFIYETQLIYSRVGNNEIANSYEDLPPSVSRFLRSRKEGSVYQYLFRIGRDCSGENTDIPWEDVDRYEEEESTLIPMTDEAADPARKTTCFYEAGRDVELRFPVMNGSSGAFRHFRWDPMEHSCMFILEEASILLSDGTKKDLFIRRSNADLEMESLYVFFGDDPQIYFEADSVDGCPTDGSEIRIRLTLPATDLNKEPEAGEMHRAAVLTNLFAGRMRDTVLKLENRLSYLESKPLNDRVEELAFIVERRDRDIEELRGEIGRLQGEIGKRDEQLAEQRAYIEKKECDILELKSEITKKDGQLKEQGSFIEKQESDIRELQNQITQKDAQLTEQGSFIEKQEHDIRELKTYIERANAPKKVTKEKVKAGRRSV